MHVVCSLKENKKEVLMKNFILLKKLCSNYKDIILNFTMRIVAKHIKKVNHFLTSLYTNSLTLKPAFTLAEILITLAIIGVVAAMTIPNLMMTYQKKQTVTRLKRAYSVVQQAIRLSQDENGEVDSWDTNLYGSPFFHKYIANYVKFQNEYTSVDLKTKAPRILLNGQVYTGTTYTSVTSSHFTLLDGSMISMNLNLAAEKGLWVGIDVNGLDKPNQIGKDTFLFFFSSQYGLRPLGEIGTPASWNYGKVYSRRIVGPKGSSGNACAVGKSGYWCAALIMQDGWAMASDYPWKVK